MLPPSCGEDMSAQTYPKGVNNLDGHERANPAPGTNLFNYLQEIDRLNQNSRNGVDSVARLIG